MRPLAVLVSTCSVTLTSAQRRNAESSSAPRSRTETGQAIKLGDDQRLGLGPAGRQRGQPRLQRSALQALAAGGLGQNLDELVAVEAGVGFDLGALGLEAEAGVGLAVGADAEVADSLHGGTQYTQYTECIQSVHCLYTDRTVQLRILPLDTPSCNCREYGEERFISVGKVARALLVVTHTERDGRIRLISARPASRREDTIDPSPSIRSRP